MKNGAEKQLIVWGEIESPAGGPFQIFRTYRLRADSPCIDRGAAVSGIALDVDGGPRMVGRGVDVGADEFATEPTKP